MNREITKEMTFAEIIKEHPEFAKVLINEGMHCINCPMAQMESLADGARAHGLNPEKLVEKLNKKLKNKK